MADQERKPEPVKIDPLNAEQLLEIELMQKRAAWQQAKSRRGNLRAMSFLFLFIVVVAALLAFFFVLTPERVNDLKSNALHASPSPSPDGPSR